jgi:hypothetical protein
MAVSKLKTLAGTDLVMIRTWHISIFTFLISFVVLYTFFDVFRPTTLSSGPGDYVVPSNSGTAGPYNLGSSNSDKSKKNKMLSDQGRIIVMVWSISLAAAIGILIHFLLVYYK